MGYHSDDNLCFTLPSQMLIYWLFFPLWFRQQRGVKSDCLFSEDPIDWNMGPDWWSTGSSNLQTNVICCNTQPQAKGKRKHLHGKNILGSAICLLSSALISKHNIFPEAVLLLGSLGLEMLGTESLTEKENEKSKAGRKPKMLNWRRHWGRRKGLWSFTSQRLCSHGNIQQSWREMGLRHILWPRGKPKRLSRTCTVHLAPLKGFIRENPPGNQISNPKCLCIEVAGWSATNERGLQLRQMGISPARVWKQRSSPWKSEPQCLHCTNLPAEQTFCARYPEGLGERIEIEQTVAEWKHGNVQTGSFPPFIHSHSWHWHCRKRRQCWEWQVEFSAFEF